MITKYEIQEMIAYYSQLETSLQHRINELPKGSLYFKKQHGLFRAYQWYDGKEIYLGAKKHDLISSLASRKRIAATLPLVRENISLLKQLSEHYTDINDLPLHSLNPEYDNHALSQQSSVPDAKATLSPEKIIRLGPAPLSPETFRPVQSAWMKCHDGGFDYMPEGKRHITSDGTLVRSRVELIIYEYLKNAGVAFVYESPVLLRNRWVYPDFKLLRSSDRRIILWDHFGMMGNQEYRVDAENKMSGYIRNGYWPMDNLITTFDSGNDSVDISQLGRMLTAMGLIH